jgi:signal transduction histidine kinase/ligand-binding sensor domain-containing protein
MNARALAAACVIASWPVNASALDASLDMSQYAHTAWRIREGFTSSLVTSIAQTPDGYLWIGTENGLTRFDGVRNVPWQPRSGEALPGATIRVLATGRDGTLWIGTNEGLASLKDDRLVMHPRLAGQVINGLAEDHDGTIWVAASALGGDTATFCAIRIGDPECRDQEALSAESVLLTYVDRGGRVWALCADEVWRLRPGPAIVIKLHDPITGGIQIMAEDADGALLVSTAGGVRRILDDRVEPFGGVAANARASLLFRDRDGAIWMADERGGLLHVHHGHSDRFGRADGLSSDNVRRVFEDREGNIWVTTSEGLDRFREYAVPTLSTGQGLASENLISVLATRDAGVWLATSRGVDRWKNGEVATSKGIPQRGASLFEDRRGRTWIGGITRSGWVENGRFVALDGVPPGYVDAFAEDRQGNVWISHRPAGLLRWNGATGIERMPVTSFKTSPMPVRLAVDLSRDGLWLGFVGGIAYLEDGRVREQYGIAEGLGRGRVRSLRFDAQGALWIATDGGLSRMKAGRIATLRTRNGLPCDGVDWMIDDDGGSYWLYTDCALVRVARADLDAWAAAADRGERATRTIQATVMGASDGVVTSGYIGTFTPHVSKAADGRLWFVTRKGAAVLDPRHIKTNALAPPVRIEGVEADRQPYENTGAALKLPPLVHDLQVDYTALSFVAPEKVRFRYKLEGRDREWVDAGNRRRAFYADLSPGFYRFRVIAANDSGVWNETGDSLHFSIAPAWWQTNGFRVSLAGAIALLLIGLYRLRIAYLARQFNLTLDTRVNERMRIARDLHDTLLQSFHGLLLRLQTASQLWPSGEGKAMLDRTIDQAAAAVTEGRDAVQGLRASATEMNDLAEAIRTLGETLATEYGNGDPPLLRVEVLGPSRAVHPILRDEIFRVAGEAMRNAFRHAHARQVEVEIHYDVRQLRLRIRDDGKGIDTAVLAQGAREGHYGLPGMRERAKSIEGKLTLWSAPGAGTEVELAIPASHAYSAAPAKVAP